MLLGFLFFLIVGSLFTRVVSQVNLMEYGHWGELERGVILSQCVDGCVVTVSGSVIYVLC